MSAQPITDDFPVGQGCRDTQRVRAHGDTNHLQAIFASPPTGGTPAGTNSPGDQKRVDTHAVRVAGDQTTERGQDGSGNHSTIAPLGTDSAGGAIGESTPKPPARPLLDPLLTVASIALDDLEALRIAQENRYRSLTTTGESENGVEWGYGLDDSIKEVAEAGAMVEAIAALEHKQVLSLQRLMRKHPLGPWVKAQHGIGDKLAARLLGVIGDPYWHTVEERPRTVSELWAYCGLHTTPARPTGTDTHLRSAGGEYNVAARRKKGVQANWSDDAKKRAWLIATSIVKAGGPWREVYDRRREATAERVHQTECVRCGPSGRPAQPGSPWSKAHQHADALRILSKEVLKGFWRESRRLHTGE